jgi:two-component system response regulator AtoC
MYTMEQRILIVDDEENIRHTLSLILNKEGYQVETAADGLAALELIQTNDYEVILCDVRMPRLTGMGLLDRLQDEGLTANVVVMSAYGNVDSAIDAMKAGAYDYISKPFKKDEVLLTLRKVHERQRLKRENRVLREAVLKEKKFDQIISGSESMQKIFRTIEKVAGYPTTVLITGESGTGKELVARAIHSYSNRSKAPFVAINCGAIPELLLESELFGYTKGAFTGAVQNKTGLFEEAGDGTLFLDEVGSLPLALQVKLLRVLQEGEFRRVGENKERKLSARVVSANAEPLSDLVEKGLVREDLYYRLNVMPIKIPPLRERVEDIPLLIDHFIEKIGVRLESTVCGISPAARRALIAYSWPGNIRELENAVERAVVMSEGNLLLLDALPENIRKEERELPGFITGEDLSIKKGIQELERILIERALRKTKGNRTHAAQLLEISHKALLYKIKGYGLSDVS